MSKRIIPDDSFDIQVILDAMNNYAESKREHDEARDSYDGYSWGYYGQSYVNKMERDSLEIKKLLLKLIDERIEAKLSPPSS